MGLSFVPSDGAPATWWSEAVAKGIAPSSAFSYFIDNTNSYGGITYGGIDVARFAGPLAWATVQATASNFFSTVYVYWQVSLIDVRVGTNAISIPSNMPIVIDTGTSLTLFPLSIAQEINSLMGLRQLNTGSSSGSYLWGTPCPNGNIPSSFTPITLTVGSVKLVVAPSTYVFQQADSTGRIICISGISGQDTSSKQAILGNVILRQFYTVFDFSAKKIGFAECNRFPNVTSQLVAGSFAKSPNGTADPNSVMNSVSQLKSFAFKNSHSIMFLSLGFLLYLI
jgi:hypothetical protein